MLWQWDEPLIEAGRLTLPGLLRTHGYRTAAIGKWHLGLNWPFASAESVKKLSANQNLNQDPTERHNLHAKHPEIVAKLKTLLEKYKADGRSAPIVAARSESSP